MADEQYTINTDSVPIYVNLNVAVPTGAIIMWSGEIKNVPAGWILCDGQNGTPDLRGKFIVGYDSNDIDYNAIRKVGGEKKHILTIEEMPQHTHKQTDDGSHTHNYTDRYFLGRSDQSDQGGHDACIGFDMSANKTTENSTHNHKIEAIGGNIEHENRPPFYVLAFIMKTY